MPTASGQHFGTMDKILRGYGFVAQDSGEAEIFVMPMVCAAFANKSVIGTRG